MPLLAAAFIRVLIQSVISLASFSVLDWILSPLVDKAKAAVAKAYGVTGEEAEDLLANEIIDALAMIGIIGITIKSKLPTVVAEKLKFTSKGYAKRPISPKVPKTDVGSVAATISKASAATVLTVPEATAAISTARATMRGASKAFDFLTGKLNTVFLGFLVVGGFIDFGNWETGAYSNFFQKLFATITFGILVPNEDWRKTKTASPEVFTKVYETYKISGAIGINDPYKKQSVQFSRDNLIDLIDNVGAALLLSTGSASVKDILLATQLSIVFDSASVAAAGVGTTSAVPSPTTSVGSGAALPRVFTGIVAQGVVGKGLVFESRPDDMIESLEELKAAAANNLTPYLNTLLGKIVYEVKVVSSIITKEGFKQTGTTQQIRNGEYQNGTPKYKTVTNKFATLNVFALTDKGTRSKLTTIVLGPTNSAKLTVGQNDLRTVETALPDLVTTTDINAITGIETTASVTVSTPPAAGGTSVPAPATDTAVTSAQPVSTPTSGSSRTGDNALTLSDWFRAWGQPLLNLRARSYHYEQLGLGQQTYYTGTAEQNTKLLAALKRSVAQAPAGAIWVAAEDDAPEGSVLESFGGSLFIMPKAAAPKTETTSTSSSAAVPTMKGKKVNISSSKISVKKNSKGEEYAVIDGTMFSTTEYSQFKKLRAKL